MNDEAPASAERISRSSSDALDERLEKLRDLVPEAFPEGRLDVEKLREAVGEESVEDPGRYMFTWGGKSDAVEALKGESVATLSPDRDASVEFDQTGHVFVDGENLEVLKLLYKAYFGRVRMIYIDPPYNTGNDFIYRDDWADPVDAYLQATGQVSEEGELLTSSPETGGRYHSRWLSLMYPRLFLARQLLRDDGAIFVSIDDNELHHLRMILNEIFGEENFIATVIWQKVYAPKNTARHFSVDHDYVVVYARDAETWRPNLLPRTEEADARYSNPDDDPRGPWKGADLTARNPYKDGQYEVTSPSGATFTPPRGRYWTINREKFEALDEDDRIWWGEDGANMPAGKKFLSEVKQGIVPQTLWTYDEVGHTQRAKKELKAAVDFQETENVLDTVKPTDLVRRMLRLATDPSGGDVVLDFFAGSGVTADAVLRQNREDGGDRRFLCVQFPEPLPKPEDGLETITDIALQRIRSVVRDLEEAEDEQMDLGDDGLEEDLGMRVFRLSPSNTRRWPDDVPPDIEPEEYIRQMEAFLDPLEDGWTPEAVVHEVALREGFSLGVTVEAVDGLEDATVYRVAEPDGGRSFHISLDDEVRLEGVADLDLGKEDLFVCRDVALDDTAAANLGLQCRLKTI